MYADCLAQTIFAAYWEAFVDSHKQFDGRFKQDIVSLCSEWVAGEYDSLIGLNSPRTSFKHHFHFDFEKSVTNILKIL